MIMPALRFSRIARLSSALILAGCLSLVHAAELGDAVVRSHIGQPLIADVELTGMADPAVPVQVRLANTDVYRGARLAVPAILSNLNMSVMRRDNRQFLHITSTRPVESNYLHLFLDLNDGGRRHVRAVTVWLTPDPQPAPPPAPAPVAAAPVARVAEPPLAPAAAPRPRIQAPASVQAACPQASAEQLRTCAALDYKNGVLSARIVELEEKVKALQTAFEGRADLAPLPAPSVKPAAPPAKAKAEKKKKKAGTPWLLIGGGVAALLVAAGAVLFVLKRRKKAKGAPAAPKVKSGLMAKLSSRFKRNKAAPGEPAPLEPSAD